MLSLLTAMVAVAVSHFSNQAAQRGSDIAESGLHEDRFNNAVQNLGNPDSVEVRLGGVYQLASLIHDVPRYHAPALKQLASLVRNHAPLLKCGDANWEVPNDVQGALSVIGNNNRPPAKSSMRFSSDLSRTCLRGANMAQMNFERANLHQANLSHALLNGSTLAGVYAFGADFSGAMMMKSDLTCSILTTAKIRNSMLLGAKLLGADMIAVDLTESLTEQADMSYAQVDGAIISSQQINMLAKPLGPPQPYCLPPDQYFPIIPGLEAEQ
ncbi:pentapeptide repeat-containing protein [Actinophytocola algeriensis]|uniref:Pentapeptide repeat protein n=1 Tax=Actinophytocola algeriensis TaxID=1768010 RepID=A0A7W7VFE5_9PSEU|nr:pentapeptide repeat-containing protein [Actinophytocola algeriensis]MBB4908232.1 hypothetical protein [Actinophytocola algeriensis]MBE1480262.1 hypothetical protein [Actinophytocola algeriensis]